VRDSEKWIQLKRSFSIKKKLNNLICKFIFEWSDSFIYVFIHWISKADDNKMHSTINRNIVIKQRTRAKPFLMFPLLVRRKIKQCEFQIVNINGNIFMVNLVMGDWSWDWWWTRSTWSGNVSVVTILSLFGFQLQFDELFIFAYHQTVFQLNCWVEQQSLILQIWIANLLN
jgi:hypothetical protein